MVQMPRRSFRLVSFQSVDGDRFRPTKKRIIHVSIIVRCAGRMENQDMARAVDDCTDGETQTLERLGIYQVMKVG